jgi:diguanylate cyclase (GGDEF)-like protein
MTPGRLTKALQRRLTVLWRDQPSQSDIEELEANTERVGLVIRLRWAIVLAIAAFSMLGVGIYIVGGQAGLLAPHMIIPALALMFVLVYNYYYHRTYRQFGNLAIFNVAQLLLDIAVVSVLVYYSGGVYSWFDAMYFLFVLEGALILPTRRQVWWVAGAAAGAYVGIVALVAFGVLPPMSMPFVANDLQTNGSYVAVRALWTVTVILGTATVGEMFVRSNRERAARFVELAIRDMRTGLYDRAWIRHELAVEIERSRRFGRGVSVVLADIDHFEHFNELFGTESGNRMIDRIADVLRAIADADGDTSLVQAGRYGGEEFALIVPEDTSAASSEGITLAERVRAEVSAILDEDRSVTVSVGVAAYSRDGRTASELLSAADAALVRAAAEGGNRVIIGRDPSFRS